MAIINLPQHLPGKVCSEPTSCPAVHEGGGSSKIGGLDETNGILNRYSGVVTGFLEKSFTMDLFNFVSIMYFRNDGQASGSR